MTAAILAGGKGTRFGGDTKVLTPIGKRPFIRYVVDNLHASGVNIIYICGGRRLGLVMDEVWADVNGYAIEWDPELGTGGAIKGLLSSFPVINEILVLNGDTCFKIPLDIPPAPAMLLSPSTVGNADCLYDEVIVYAKSFAGLPYIDCGGLYRRADFDNTPTIFDMELVIDRIIRQRDLRWCLVNGPVHHIGTKAGYRAARRYYALHKRLP